MLTGTLVTIACFVPDRVSRAPPSANTPAASSGSSRSRSSLRGSSRSAFTPVLGVLAACPVIKRGSGARPAGDPLRVRRPYGILRHLVRPVRRPPAHDHRPHGLCFSSWRSPPSPTSSSSSSPFPSVLNCFLQLRLPQGSTSRRTLASVVQAESLVAASGYRRCHLHCLHRRGQPPFSGWGLNPELPNEAFAEIRDRRPATSPPGSGSKTRLETAIARGALPDARARVDRFNFGPPVGFPVQVRVVGTRSDEGSRDRLRGAARSCARTPIWSSRSSIGTRPCRSPGSSWIRAARGSSSSTSSRSRRHSRRWCRGLPVTTIREGTEQVVVVARAVANERADLGKIEDLSILGTGGLAVPLSQVARPRDVARRADPLAAQIATWRSRCAPTSSTGSSPPDAANRSWGPLWLRCGPSCRIGYRLELGGAVEESAKANQSLLDLFPVMLLVTLTLLMIQLQSFSRMALVLLTAPLGIIGASFGLILAGKPFGFVALLGLIALAGMIMRNSVILVDQIEKDVKAGRRERRDAIVEAVVRRARPRRPGRQPRRCWP